MIEDPWLNIVKKLVSEGSLCESEVVNYGYGNK
jgi:hypothetical protein